MRTRASLLALSLVCAAIAQTAPAVRPSAAPRAGQSRDPGRTSTALPDPDLFDGSKFEAEKRPETGMIGEFEMPGSNDDNPKVGGNPNEAGGNQAPPKPGAAGAAGAPAASAAGAAGAAGGGAPATPGSEQAGGGASVDNSGSAGAVGGALDQSKPMGNSGSSGAGDPNAKAEGIQADRLEGGGAAGSGGAAGAQNAAGQGSKQKPPVSKIGSAELRIDALPESEKDVIGREAAPGGTQGSNRAMPAGKGGQGSNNQNKGVEKGKVIPKGL